MSPWVLLLCAAAMADVEPDERWLSTDRVAIGLAADGSLANTEADLGLLFDPDGPEGPFPLGGDVILPGRDFELWSLSTAAGSWVMGAPDPGSDLTLSWTEPRDDGDFTWMVGTAETEAFSVELTVALPWGAGAAVFLTTIEAHEALEDLALARVFDPDLDHWADGSYATENTAEDGVAVAAGAVDGRAWALAATDGVAGVCDWCSLPVEVEDGDRWGDDDDQLGVAVFLGELAVGEQVSVQLAYGFGEDADAAADLAAAWAAVTVDPGGSDGDTGGAALDTGAPGERDDWDHAADDGPVIEAGGCTTAPAGSGMWMLGLVVLGCRRRR